MMARASLLAATMLGSVVAITPISSTTPLLLWNASASAPIGLYRVHRPSRLTDGDLVVVRPPDTLARFLANRDYLPLGVPLLKHVAARQGQTVCRDGATVSIDGGATAALAQAVDRRGRPLPIWTGCRRLAEEIFLLNRATPNSLDGRYFGPLPVAAIIGRAEPLWLRTKR